MVSIGIFDNDPPFFKIGDIEFVKLVSLTESSHLEKDTTEDVCDGVNVVAWLYDSKQASDWHNWHPDITKATKLRAFDQLYRSKAIHRIEHRYLKQISFMYGKIVERTIEVQEDLIIVSMKIKQYKTSQEKETMQNPPILSDGTDSEQTPTATNLKDNQAEVEASKINTILKTIDNMLKSLWD